MAIQSENRERCCVCGTILLSSPKGYCCKCKVNQRLRRRERAESLLKRIVLFIVILLVPISWIAAIVGSRPYIAFRDSLEPGFDREKLASYVAMAYAEYAAEPLGGANWPMFYSLGPSTSADALQDKFINLVRSRVSSPELEREKALGLLNALRGQDRKASPQEVDTLLKQGERMKVEIGKREQQKLARAPNPCRFIVVYVDYTDVDVELALHCTFDLPEHIRASTAEEVNAVAVVALNDVLGSRRYNRHQLTVSVVLPESGAVIQRGLVETDAGKAIGQEDWYKPVVAYLSEHFR